MKTKLIKGLKEIEGKYDAFFIDLWGVMHNGINLNPKAIEVIEKLRENLKKLFFYPMLLDLALKLLSF